MAEFNTRMNLFVNVLNNNGRTARLTRVKSSNLWQWIWIDTLNIPVNRDIPLLNFNDAIEFGKLMGTIYQVDSGTIQFLKKVNPKPAKKSKPIRRLPKLLPNNHMFRKNRRAG